MASEPMTLPEFEREGAAALDSSIGWAISRWEAQKQMDALRPLILRLLADERARIIAALPGGDICDPQEIADMIRTMGDQT